MRVLVLSGGGSKIAFQSGVVSALSLEAKDPYEVVAGVSCGSLAAAILTGGREGTVLSGSLASQQQRAEQLFRILRELTTSGQVYKSGPIPYLSDGIRLLRTGGLFDPSPLLAILKREVDFDSLASNPIATRIGAVDLGSGHYKAFGTQGSSWRFLPPPMPLRPITAEAVLASCSVPGLFPPVELGQMTLVDGGTRNISPLSDALDAVKLAKDPGTVEVDLVLASPLQLEEKAVTRKALFYLTRALSIHSNEVYLSDLEELVDRNVAAEAGDLRLAVRVYAPTEVHQDTMEFDAGKMQKLRDHGFDLAHRGIYLTAEALGVVLKSRSEA